jgi:hypothetical protein
MAAKLELVDAARAKNVKISEIGLGDIGATNARFALALPDGSVTPTRSYVSHDFSSLGEAVEKYLGDEAPPERPSQAALAVAYSPDLAQWKWEVLWRPGYIPRLLPSKRLPTSAVPPAHKLKFGSFSCRFCRRIWQAPLKRAPSLRAKSDRCAAANSISIRSARRQG